ncbi:MAG: hypothetical protein M1313_00815 [Nitrospirae bacterium]|nr:hypothetical protein [Nitrospirota bacterium]
MKIAAALRTSIGTKTGRILSPATFLLLALSVIFFPSPARAFDVQLMGNFDYVPLSPLQNSAPIAWGGGVRMTWEYLPDWDITATLMTNIFQTSQTIPENPVTYSPNSSGLSSITPLSFGIYHVLYRTKDKNWIYAIADVGAAFENAYGGGHITPEPFGEIGAGWSFKQWFIEERVAAVPLAFPSYPGPSFSGGPLLMITTSVGVHFFVF